MTIVKKYDEEIGFQSIEKSRSLVSYIITTVVRQQLGKVDEAAQVGMPQAAVARPN